VGPSSSTVSSSFTPATPPAAAEAGTFSKSAARSGRLSRNKDTKGTKCIKGSVSKGSSPNRSSAPLAPAVYGGDGVCVGSCADKKSSQRDVGSPVTFSSSSSTPSTNIATDPNSLFSWNAPTGGSHQPCPLKK
jgi:hypothetical protein